MTKLQYQQEYLGLFVGGIQRFFPDVLIDDCCRIDPEHQIIRTSGDPFQGIDIARMGGDDTVLISFNRIKRDQLVQIDMTIPEGQTLTDTARLIIHKDHELRHKKIYIDDGGLGVGVYDMLLENPSTSRKVVAINNARRSIDKEDPLKNPRKKKLLKEDLYNNLKSLMEQGKVSLFNVPELRQSLRSIQYENEEGQLKIYGNYTHITEALIRAAWCMKDKSLNIWVA